MEIMSLVHILRRNWKWKVEGQQMNFVQIRLLILLSSFSLFFFPLVSVKEIYFNNEKEFTFKRIPGLRVQDIGGCRALTLTLLGAVVTEEGLGAH